MLSLPQPPLRKIHRDQVRLGMFVHAFGGSWFSHPFWRARFLVASSEQLAAILGSEIDTLVIDEARGLPLAIEQTRQPLARPSNGRAAIRQARASTRRTLATSSERIIPIGRGGDDRQRAAAVLGHAAKAMRSLMRDVVHGGTLRSVEVASLVAEINASIEHNPQALVGLTRIRTKDEYTFVHSVAVCALMMTLGRRIGLEEAAVRELGTAGLLHDIGKMAIPDGMLKKPARLTDAEFALVRTHPEQGYMILQENSDVSDVVLEVARHHHERIDGTGYPLRLAGDELSLPVRIACICDVFDAVTADRPYKRAWTPAEAIGRMHGWQGHFDPSLLFVFMQTLGVFPAGLLVRLRSNRLGVVLDAGRRQARTRVRAFMSTLDREPIDLVDVVLGDTLAEDQIVAEEDPLDWGIADWTLVAEQLTTGSGRWATIARAA